MVERRMEVAHLAEEAVEIVPIRVGRDLLEQRRERCIIGANTRRKPEGDPREAGDFMRRAVFECVPGERYSTAEAGSRGLDVSDRASYS